jgi:DNA-binding MarR family transcriptional regulator
MQELADEIHLSQSPLSRLVGRLEEAGLATRAICDDDRCGIWACVTPEGRAAQERASPTTARSSRRPSPGSSPRLPLAQRLR